MGAAGNKQPKKQKHNKHVPSYQSDSSASLIDTTFKKKKKK